MTKTYAYSPETIIKAYSLGVFPMAESRSDPEINFYEPDIRGVLPLNPPHIPRRLMKLVRQKPYRITLDTDFKSVIEACAAPSDNRDDSWINPEIVTLYCALHKMGFAHSLEVWDGDMLIGGLYGVRLGRAFFLSHLPLSHLYLNPVFPNRLSPKQKHCCCYSHHYSHHY